MSAGYRSFENTPWLFFANGMRWGISRIPELFDLIPQEQPIPHQPEHGNNRKRGHQEQTGEFE